jgi:MFS family permease
MYQADSFAQLLGFRRTGRPGERALILSRNVLFLGLTSLVTDVSSEMISAILPLYVFYSLDLSPLHLGAIDGLYQGVAALARVAAGVVADRLRRLKEVAGLGYALSALCKLGLLLAGSSAPMLAALVVVDRTGKGIRTAPRDALLSLSVPSSALGAAFGVHRALDTAGAMLGPLVAFGLLALVPGAFDVLFIVSFCVGVVGVALFALFVDGRPAPAEAAAPETLASGLPPQTGTASPIDAIGRPAPLAGALELLRLPRFRALVVIGSALSAGAISDGLVFVVLQRRVRFDVSYLPLLYVASALVYMLLAVPVGRLADRVGRERVLVVGYALLAVLYGLLLVAPPGWPAILGCVALLGACYASTDGVLMALASPVLPAEVRTTGLAVLTTCTTLARLLASVLFGAAWTWWGVDRALSLFLATLVVATTALALGWKPGKESARDPG